MSTEQSNDEIERRVTDLVSAADRLVNYDAEVLEDADNPAGAARVRERAQELYREAEQLVREAGLDWFDDDSEERGDR
ncbi:hypothetical protein ACXJJ3_42130 (plasmid) [Kribbella sp. WER1]